VNPAQEKEKFRERVVQQTDQSSKGEHTSRTVNPSLANQQLFFSESDLVREIEITQEMQERGAINKDNAIILQSQRIAQIRILRSSKP
jgi:2-succinyl-5-enolpyruvyl-6-hydroxy-3-cyclohexene-1-carboxylate synthase